MTMYETSQTASATPTIPPFSTAEMRSYPLGTLVYRSGLLPLETVNRALAEAAESGRRLGEVLLEHGLAERDLTRLLAAQHGQEFVDLTEYPIDPEVAHLLPRSVAEMYCALPLCREGDCIIVAVPDADNASHLTRLQDALHGPIRQVTAARSDIKDAIERVHIEPQGMITQMALAEARRRSRRTRAQATLSRRGDARERRNAARRRSHRFRTCEADRHARDRRGRGRRNRRHRRCDNRRPTGRVGRRSRSQQR